jgi:hypothetical protein
VTDPERDQFLQEIRDLRRGLHRWQLISVALTLLLAPPLLCGGLLAAVWLPRMARDRAAAAAERDRADDALREAARWREEAEKAAREAEKRGATATPKAGKPTGALSERQKRVQRWSMTFNTQDGAHYLRQLKGIKPGTGAILAIPVGNRKYEVLRDLSQHPAKGKVEDLADIKSLFWVDEQPESVANLARALGIKAPPYIVAFFPPELEEEVARQERRKAGSANVDDIEETKIDVVRSPAGFRPVVMSIKLKGR